jgi:hypothetical protein
MKCFSHPHQDAVAICKICLKGVCPGCAQPSRIGVSCPGPCADELAKQVAMIGVAAVVTRGNQIFAGVVAPLGFLGLAAWLAYSTLESGRGVDGFALFLVGTPLALGLWLGGLSLFVALRSRSASRPLATREEEGGTP